jgi:hypothetical protein
MDLEIHRKMKSLVEVSWEEEIEGEQVTKTEKYWLMHFGLRYEVINDLAVNFTVAICSHYVTGKVEMFDPIQLRVIGTQMKE